MDDITFINYKKPEQRRQDFTLTNTVKYVSVLRDKYKLYDITMTTDDVIECYKKRATQISDTLSGKFLNNNNSGCPEL